MQIKKIAVTILGEKQTKMYFCNIIHKQEKLWLKNLN